MSLQAAVTPERSDGELSHIKVRATHSRRACVITRDLLARIVRRAQRRGGAFVRRAVPSLPFCSSQVLSMSFEGHVRRYRSNEARRGAACAAALVAAVVVIIAACMCGARGPSLLAHAPKRKESHRCITRPVVVGEQALCVPLPPLPPQMSLCRHCGALPQTLRVAFAKPLLPGRRGSDREDPDDAPLRP